MTYEERQELEALSLECFGTKSYYRNLVGTPSHYKPDTFGTAQGKRVGGYYTVRTVRLYMEAKIRQLKELENEKNA